MSDSPELGTIVQPNVRYGVSISPGGSLIECDSWDQALRMAEMLRGAGHKDADPVVYEPEVAQPKQALPPPPPGSISHEEHEEQFERHLRALKESASVCSEDDEPPRVLPATSIEWREMMFRPGMAAAMMFVLYEVVHSATTDGYESLEALVTDLRAWKDLTFPEREALVDLFVWVEREVHSPTSALPETVQSNLAAAYASYDDAGPELIYEDD